jgi:hypothetical protein
MQVFYIKFILQIGILILLFIQYTHFHTNKIIQKFTIYKDLK